MASTPSTSNLNTVSNQSPSKRRKSNIYNAMKTTSPWKNPREQQIYSSNLLSALRNIRRGDGGRAVRETADEVLAVSARGKTRWSRAILASRLSRRLCQINRIHKRAKARKGKSGLKRRVSLLGKLVPGCRKVSLPKLLEETRDYVAALEMQVRAMSVLTEVLCGGANSSPPVGLV